jgi:hypothetical protein
MKYFLLCIFLIIIAEHLPSQTFIKGYVVNKQNIGVQDALLTLQFHRNGSIVSYAYTNEKGFYQLSYTGKSDSVIVSTSGFNISKQSKVITSTDQILNFKIVEKELELREVQVKSKKIWTNKDTVNYLVSSFSNQNDLVIGDVLRKMPGIEVTENGEIRYNGKAINKFYIEKLDMLEGRYGIATNNIPARDIATVQILENHQPIKALDKNEISTDPAINLKLKDGSKGVLSIMAQLGIGVTPLLWDNELNLLYFGKKTQNITTYKGNNSGNDVAKELTSFSETDNSSDGTLMTIRMPLPLEIQQSRYLFNNSNAFTFNNLIKLDKDRQLNVNIIYLNDYEKRENSSSSSYFIKKDSVLKIAENANSSINTNKLDADIHYNINKDKYYFDNLFSVQEIWQSENGSVNDGVERVNQHLNEPEFKIYNKLHIVKRKDEIHSFDFNSYNSFKSSPQELLISPGLYTDFFKVKNYDLIKENANINEFCSRNSISLFSCGRNYFQIRSNAEININIQHEKTQLNLLNNQAYVFNTNNDSLTNDLDWFKYSCGLSSVLTYNRLAWRISAVVPVNYNLININNKQMIYNKMYNRLYINPYVMVQYKTNFNVEINFHYNYNKQMGTIKDMISGYLFTDYRTLNITNGGILQERSAHQISLDWAYKDVLSMFFCSAGLNYNYYGKNVIQNQEYMGNVGIYSLMDKSNYGEFRLVNAQISKGFDFLNAVLTLKGSYGTYFSEQASKGVIYKFDNSIEKIDFSADLKLSSHISSTISSSGGNTSEKIENKQIFKDIQSLSNNIKFIILLSKNISLKINGEHYFNSSMASLSDRNKFFADSELNWKLKTSVISVSLTNIFNTKQYITSTFNDLNSFYSVYQIRPMNLLLKVKFKIK